MTPQLLPAQSEEAFLFDLARLREDFPALFHQGPIAQALDRLVEAGGPDLRQEGLRELGLASPGGLDHVLLALARAPDAPAALGDRLAGFLVTAGAGSRQEEAYHGVTLVRVVREDGHAPYELADLPGGDVLASNAEAGPHALVRAAVDTRAGQNPSLQDRHQAQWGTLLDPTFDYLSAVSGVNSFVREALVRLGVPEVSRIDGLHARAFSDPEFLSVVGATVTFTGPTDADGAALLTALEAKLEATKQALPDDDPWRDVLEGLDLWHDQAGVTVQGMIPRELVEGVLTGRSLEG